MPYPTQEALKAALHYDPDTGIFTWTKARNRRTKAGMRAGCVKTKKYNRQYRQIYFDRHTCLEHRLAFIHMTGSAPELIDHENLNGLDNRWNNLRPANQVQNMRNQKLISRNTSGVCGVHLVKTSGMWSAQIYAKKHFALGRFHDFFDAVCARKSAEVKHDFSINHGRRLAA